MQREVQSTRQGSAELGQGLLLSQPHNPCRVRLSTVLRDKARSGVPAQGCPPCEHQSPWVPVEALGGRVRVGAASELVPVCPAAGPGRWSARGWSGGSWVLGWRQALEQGGPTLTACGPHVAVHTVALPTDGVTVHPTPTVTAQGTARPEGAPAAVKVTGGPCAPRGAEAEASDRVTGCRSLAVTLLAAALSIRAQLAPLLTELALEAGRAETLATDGVAGGSVLAHAHTPAAGPVEAGRAGVLACWAVEARAAVTGPCSGLTGGVVVTGAFQAAAGTVVPQGAGQLTVQPRPAEATGAAAIGGVAQTPVSAEAHMLTAHAKPVLGTATFTVDADPPWGADAGATHRVTGHPLSTSAQVGTASAEAALWTGVAAVGPEEPSWAVAGPSGCVTGAPIETPT